MEQKPENINSQLTEQLYVIRQELRKLQKQNTYLYQQQIRQTDKQLPLQMIQTQFQELHQRLDNLQQHRSQGANGLGEDAKTQFLLAEFSEICKFWMQTDARLETSIRLYLTVSAVMVSIAVFVGDYQSKNTSSNILELHIFLSSMIMSIVGFFVFTLIVKTMINKSGYVYALNLIRRFFTENSPEIIPYLYLPVAPTLMNEGELSLEKLQLEFRGRLTRIILTVSVLLAGISFGTLSYIQSPQALVYRHFVVGSLVSILSLLISNSFNRERIKHHLKRIERLRQEGLTSMRHQSPKSFLPPS